VSRALVFVLIAGCGASRAPLPAPAAELSWVEALPVPEGEPAALEPPQLPPIASFQLENGLNVQLVESRALPTVFAALVGRSSNVQAPAEIEALIELALEGSAAMGGVDAEVNQRGVMLTDRLASGDLPGILAHYRAVLEGRALAADRVELARSTLLGRARFAQGQRSRYAELPPEEEILTRLYGAQHSRARRMRMRSNVLERADIDALRQHLALMTVPSESSLVFVGDIDAAGLEATIRRNFASIPARTVPARTVPAALEFPDPETRLRIFGTGREDPRSVIMLAERGPPIEHEDHPAFRLFARLAGGMFSSALNLRLRESRGEAYGVITTVSDHLDHSLLEMTLVVPVSAAPGAASAIVDELTRLSDASRIEAEELELARRVELAELTASLESSAGLGRALAGAFLARDTPSSVTEVYHRVAALDAGDIASVARRWVRPDKAPMVIVGDYLWLFTHPVRVPGGVGFVGR
jgi:zinc protease